MCATHHPPGLLYNSSRVQYEDAAKASNDAVDAAVLRLGSLLPQGVGEAMQLRAGEAAAASAAAASAAEAADAADPVQLAAQQQGGQPRQPAAAQPAGGP